MSEFVEDNWIPTSDTSLKLIQNVALVKFYVENPASPQKHGWDSKCLAGHPVGDWSFTIHKYAHWFTKLEFSVGSSQLQSIWGEGMFVHISLGEVPQHCLPENVQNSMYTYSSQR